MILPEPLIETLPAFRLIGLKLRMSYADNRTRELWQAFMPRRHEISGVLGPERYSVEVFDDPSAFLAYDPDTAFDKWAAVRVGPEAEIPDGMAELLVPEGGYAIFPYQGRPSEAGPFFQAIFGRWFPSSPWAMDDRPHLAVMGKKYLGEDPDSEEEIRVPVR